MAAIHLSISSAGISELFSLRRFPKIRGFSVIVDRVGIIRTEIYFCVFYRCVNAGDSRT